MVTASCSNALSNTMGAPIMGLIERDLIE